MHSGPYIHKLACMCSGIRLFPHTEKPQQENNRETHRDSREADSPNEICTPVDVMVGYHILALSNYE